MLLELPLPAVISAAERLIKPLKTKNADLSSAPDEKIQEMGLKELRLSPDEVGVKASPTWVADIVNVSVTRSPQIWDGSDVPTTALKLFNVIRSRKEGSNSQRSTRVPVGGQDHTDREFWVWIEFLQNQVRPVSLEILATAASLAAERRGSVGAISASQLTLENSNLLARHGADRIFHISGELYHPDRIVSLLCERIVAEKPYALFFPATSRGKYLAPRIAARLGLGLTGDCVGLSFDGADQLTQLKPAFGGNIIAPIYSRTYPQMATIRPGALESRIPREQSDSPQVVHWQLPETVPQQFTMIAQEIDPGIEAVQLDHAKFVACMGIGLGEENANLAHRLSTLMDGCVAATRRVVDNGWIPRQFQVGLTGKFIAPEVYLGLGVSGRYNHMIGVQKSGLIIAINQDPSAEIFNACDIGIRGDCVAITAELIRLLETS